MALNVLNTTTQLSGNTLLTEEGAWTITGTHTYTTNPVFNGSFSSDVTFADNVNLTFGTGGDVDLDYNGTDLVLNLTVVGSGDFVVTGGSVEFDDNEGTTYGTGKDAKIQYNGTDLVISPAVVGSGDVHVSGGSVEVDDSESFTLGTGKDATIAYNGTDLVITPAAVGSGDVVISGGSVELDDSESLTIGTGKDVTLLYDGTDAILNTAVGTGEFKITGSGIAVSATERVYLDGGTHSYVHESAGDTVQIVSGGTATFTTGVSGPHALGGATANNHRFGVLGSYTSGGAGSTSAGFANTGALTGAGGDTTYHTGALFDASFTTSGVSEAVTLVSQVYINEPAITVGTATVTNSAALYIAAAATEATNDYAIWVDAGNVLFDGDLTVGGSIQSPTLVTPALGTPASGVGTNLTGIPYTGLANGTDGELITWDSSGVAANVAVGDAGQVLTSNGAGAEPTMQDGGGAWTDIGTAAAGSGIIEVSGLSTGTYIAIRVFIKSLESDTDDSGVRCTINSITTSTYHSSINGVNQGGLEKDGGITSGAYAPIAELAATSSSLGNAAEEALGGCITIYNGATTNRMTATFEVGYVSAGADYIGNTGHISVDLGSGTSFTGIKLYMESGNIDNGNIYVYGLKT
jgi:hypothetical protein